MARHLLFEISGFFFQGVPGFLGVFRAFLGVFLVSWGCSGFSWECSRFSWGVPGFFRGVPGFLGGVLGFLGCSGFLGSVLGFLGVFRVFRLFRNVPCCSSVLVFLVLVFLEVLHAGYN